jgi:hypothetical protein
VREGVLQKGDESCDEENAEDRERLRSLEGLDLAATEGGLISERSRISTRRKREGKQSTRKKDGSLSINFRVQKLLTIQ